MTTFSKWIIKHKSFVRNLLLVIEILLFVPPIAWSGLSIGVVLLICIPIAILLVFVNAILVGMVYMPSYTKTLRELTQNGDPKPALDMTQELLDLPFSEIERAQFLINHSLALSETGELQRACDLLRDLDIEKIKGLPLMIKVIYYNNFTSFLYLLGDDVEAELCYATMTRLYCEMKEGREKRLLKDTFTLTMAEHCARNGNDREADRLLQELSPNNSLSRKTAINLLRANMHLRANEPEAARQLLQEIIATGNGLYAVKRAQKMLEHLEG